MSLTQTDRPQFYQGQFLGPDELAASVEYGRLQRARHILGGHTWGIAIGLDLIEIPVPGDDEQVDVYIQPGYAWDGFGRPIVLFTPQKLPLELLKDEPSGLVKIWIRYTELPTGTVKPGFENCLNEGFSRIRESFLIEIGNLAHSDQHDEIILAEQSVDAMETFRFFDADDPADNPLLCDESVPFQTFPKDNIATCWRIPLGFVNWERGIDGQPGSVVKMADPLQQKESRSVRRYIGAVAEDLFAADGIIRLRNRKKEAPADGNFTAACEAERIDHLTDLDLTIVDDQLKPTDLVWIEGNLRTIGDVKLFGGSLDFRDSDGLPFNNDAGSTPRLFIQRAEHLSGEELRVLLGNSGDGSNRLAIGAIETGEDQFPDPPDSLQFVPRVVIQDNAKVGIGTEHPASFSPEADNLVVSSRASTGISIVSEASSSGSLLFADGDQASGDSRRGFMVYDHGLDQLRIGTAGLDQLTILSNGNVGMGTTDPQYSLEIRRPVHQGFSVGMGGDTGRIWTEYQEFGPNLIFYDRDDVGGMIRFRESPTTDDENVPEFEATITGRRGNIGIDETEPREKLHINGSIRGNQSGALRISTQNGWVDVGPKNSIWSHFMTDRSRFWFNKEIQVDTGLIGSYNENLSLRTSGITRVTILENNGNMGIGTPSPNSRLHIIDNINESAGEVSSHVATIENTASGSNASVLALKVNNSTPGDGNHFITFFGDGNMRGRVEGSGAGVAILSGSGDFAECLPRLDKDEKIETGDIVGIFSGKITKTTAGAHHLTAITNQPIVVGNTPSDPAKLSLYEKVAFIGQLPVKVRGKVHSGDFILPSGSNDGTGIAVSQSAITPDQYAKVIGKAWESSEEAAVKMINISVGLPLNNLGDGIIASIKSQQLEINKLRAEINYLRLNNNN